VFVQSGKDMGPGRSSFTAPLPSNAIVTVRRVKGRNDIGVVSSLALQQVQRRDWITDSRGGNDDTEVVVSW
jgi:hypothetical protein